MAPLKSEFNIVFPNTNDGFLDFIRALGVVFIVKDNTELFVLLCFLTTFTMVPVQNHESVKPEFE